jgi:hypothetical protein
MHRNSSITRRSAAAPNDNRGVNKQVVSTAVARVRAAHGTASDPEHHYEVTSSCVDDRGTRFSLGEL